jgi:hypothetical protein
MSWEKIEQFCMEGIVNPKLKAYLILGLKQSEF